MNKITATLATIGTALALAAPTAAAHADDPHVAQPLEVRAQFYGSCSNWYVAMAGIQQDLQPNEAAPTAEVEVDIRYAPVFRSLFTTGTYREVHHYGWKRNGVPKLVQVYADGVLIRERLFGCGYFQK